MKGLTAKQRDILAYIEDFISTEGRCSKKLFTPTAGTSMPSAFTAAK